VDGVSRHYGYVDISFVKDIPGLDLFGFSHKFRICHSISQYAADIGVFDLAGGGKGHFPGIIKVRSFAYIVLIGLNAGDAADAQVFAGGFDGN